MSGLQGLPGLTFAVAPVPAREIGAQGRLEWLALSALRIDASYQRHVLETGKANIRRMIERFSWALFGVLVVGERGGGAYAIIDGQHRATAAKLHGGIAKVPCLILTGGVEDEARAFSAINGNVTRIHALQAFRAAVAAKDAGAVELVELCRAAGVTIAPYPKGALEPGETFALGTLKKALAQHTAGLLRVGLKLLRACDPGAGLSAHEIAGTIALLAKEPALAGAGEQLAAYLAARGGLAQLTVRAVKRRASYGGTLATNFENVLRGAIGEAKSNRAAPMARLMAGR